MWAAERVVTDPSGLELARYRVGVPTNDAEGYWTCACEIEHGGETFTQAVGGVDSVQALLLAFTAVRRVLAKQDIKFEGRWFDHQEVPKILHVVRDGGFTRDLVAVVEWCTERYAEQVIAAGARGPIVAPAELATSNTADVRAALVIALEAFVADGAARHSRVLLSRRAESVGE